MSYFASLKMGASRRAQRRRRAGAGQAASRQLFVTGRASSAIQLHGGIGVTDEYIGSHYFKLA